MNGEDVYPPDARRLEIEGKVVLKIGIDENGTVVHVKVIERAGHGFDEAAAKAMRESKFTPAIANEAGPSPTSSPDLFVHADPLVGRWRRLLLGSRLVHIHSVRGYPGAPSS